MPLDFEFTPVGKFVDSVVTSVSGKTSELTHLHSLFVKKKSNFDFSKILTIFEIEILCKSKKKIDSNKSFTICDILVSNVAV